MDSMNENVIEFTRDNRVATVTFCQGRYVTKVKELAKKYPEEVQITHENEDGSIVAHIPTSYIKINKRTHNLTDEQRQELSDRLKAQLKKDETD